MSFSAVCTAGILLPLHFTIGIRLKHDDELVGLDRTVHGELWHGPTAVHSSKAKNNENAVHPDASHTNIEMPAIPPSAGAANQQ